MAPFLPLSLLGDLMEIRNPIKLDCMAQALLNLTRFQLGANGIGGRSRS